MKKYIYTVFIALVLILTSVHSFAEFTITPGVSIREEYNDNIYLVDISEEYDLITTFAPFISLEYAPNDALDLNLNYDLAFRHFVRHEFRGEETHAARMSVSARPFKRFSIDVNDRYAREIIDSRDTYDSDNSITNMTDSNLFSISAKIVLPMSASASTTAGYAYTDLWFDDARSANSERQAIFLVLKESLSSKLTGTLRYNYSLYRPDQTGQQGSAIEYDRHDSSFAVDYRITSNFGIDGELGESWTDYNTRDKSRMTFWNVGADYAFQAISDASIEIDYSKSLSDSPISGASTQRRGDLFFRISNILELTVNPFFAKDIFVNTNRKDRMIGVNVDILQPLGEKASVLLNGSSEDQLFLPKAETVRKYGLGCSFDYKLSANVTSGIGYKYKVRNSNINTYDFTNNIVWMQARVSF